MLALPILLAQVALPPVFLDGPRTVTAWFEQPRLASQAKKGLSIKLGKRLVPVIDASPIGQPARTTPGSPHRVVLAGTFQHLVGGSDWNPDGSETEAREIAPGVFALDMRLPKGDYEFKVARGGSWDENYGAGFEAGGANIRLSVPSDRIVRIQIDFNQKSISNSIDDTSLVPGVPQERKNDARPYQAYRLKLGSEIRISDLALRPVLLDSGKSRRVTPRSILSAPEFVYSGTDLGATWSKKNTAFRVWSPTAEKMDLVLYASASGPARKTVPMSRSEKGTWTCKVSGDLNGTFYCYRPQIDGTSRLASDPYGRAASQDMRRTMVIDLDRTDPQGWTAPKPDRARATDRILYEVHVGDFTASPTSGLSKPLAGTYAGMSISGLGSSKQPIGLDYLKSLGVTDIHLLPIQGFGFGGYTWGYATTLFNVPTPAYAKSPQDPLSPVREFKGLVQTLHRHGLRVVMDVVYNHTWPGDGPDSNFQQLAPYYYLRTDERGQVVNESGVGNALADQHPMARKFVRDSLLYWLREYGVDGFRFDLLGIHEPDSVRDWEKAIRTVRPDATIYGEPWTGGGPTRFAKGAQKGMGVGVFNDDFRNAFRGGTNDRTPGFVCGQPMDIERLKNAVLGSINTFAVRPGESINYVSAHDDMTLRDKIAYAMGDASEEERQRSVLLATAAVLLSQGVPFLEGGVELGRTKGMKPNTYNDGPANLYDWKRAEQFQGSIQATRDLIALRQTHPAFRMNDAAAIRKNIRFLPDSDGGCVAWTIDGAACGDSWSTILVVLNGSRQPRRLNLPAGDWTVAYGGDLGASLSGETTIPPLTALVARR